MMHKLHLSLVAATAVFLAACASTPLGTANSPDQVVLASYQTARIILEAAVAVVNDPATPREVAEPIRNAVLAAEPYFVALHDADLAVDAARAAIAAGTGTQEKLAIALGLLAQAQSKAVAPLAAVSDAVGAAR